MIDLPERKEVIKREREKGKLIAGVFPIHYPRELLRAFDIHPVEIWGPPGVDPKRGNAHLQSYICSIVRNGLSFLLEKAYKIVDLILVPHNCDSLQGLGSLLTDFIYAGKPSLVFYPPRGKGKCDIKFLTSEIKRLYGELRKITGKAPDEKRLLYEIEREEKAEERLLELYRKRARLTIESYDFYRVIRAREYLDPDTLMEVCNNIKEAENRTHLKPILLSGIVPEPMEMLTRIEEMGAYIAADDLASCRRRIYGKGKSRDPFMRMAERLLKGPPDPTRGSSFEERKAFIKGLIQETGAKAVVFYNIKFCEAEEFYYPIIKSFLKDMEVKSVEVEIDLNDPLPQQALTRINALIESVE